MKTEFFLIVKALQRVEIRLNELVKTEKNSNLDICQKSRIHQSTPVHNGPKNKILLHIVFVSESVGEGERD